MYFFNQRLKGIHIQFLILEEGRVIFFQVNNMFLKIVSLTIKMAGLLFQKFLKWFQINDSPDRQQLPQFCIEI